MVRPPAVALLADGDISEQYAGRRLLRADMREGLPPGVAAELTPLLHETAQVRRFLRKWGDKEGQTKEYLRAGDKASGKTMKNTAKHKAQQRKQRARRAKLVGYLRATPGRRQM